MQAYNDLQSSSAAHARSHEALFAFPLHALAGFKAPMQALLHARKAAIQQPFTRGVPQLLSSVAASGRKHVVKAIASIVKRVAATKMSAKQVLSTAMF